MLSQGLQPEITGAGIVGDTPQRRQCMFSSIVSQRFIEIEHGNTNADGNSNN